MQVYGKYMKGLPRARKILWGPEKPFQTVVVLLGNMLGHLLNKLFYLARLEIELKMKRQC